MTIVHTPSRSSDHPIGLDADLYLKNDGLNKEGLEDGETSRMDDRSATWHGFVHMVRWFAVHALIDIFGIFCFLQDHIAAGVFFFIAGTSVLVGGIATLPAAAKPDLPDQYHHDQKGRIN